MAANHWLVKQEPEAFSWSDFLQEGRTAWSGIRNFQARNHLRAMKNGDRVFFYHSGSAKEVVGVAKVVREAYPDPTAKEGDWSSVDLAPVKPLKQPVALATIKTDHALRDLPLLRQSRLSVLPLTAGQFRRILELGHTTP
jgi:predicted RNA-binding protein with PUA-like domain